MHCSDVISNNYLFGDLGALARVGGQLLWAVGLLVSYQLLTVCYDHCHCESVRVALGHLGLF